VCTEGIVRGDFLTQDIKIEQAESTVIPRHPRFQEPLTLELSNFIQVIQGKLTKPLVTAEDATNVTKVAEAALLSSNTGSPIYMDLK
jgi:UDP-N-acetylglucosamine 3-dehydrogenase